MGLSQTDERIVNKALWVIVLSGRHITRSELATELPAILDLESHIDRLVKAGILEYDRFGARIYGVYGITLAPTDHALRLGQRRLFARSLSAAIRIMEQLEETGDVLTRCPRCGARLRLRVRRGKVRRGVRARLHNRSCSFCFGSVIQTDHGCYILRRH